MEEGETKGVKNVCVVIMMDAMMKHYEYMFQTSLVFLLLLLRK